MITAVQIKFDPYYYYPDGTHLVIMPGAYKLFAGKKLIGSADTLKQAEAIKVRYYKDMNDHGTD